MQHEDDHHAAQQQSEAPATKKVREYKNGKVSRKSGIDGVDGIRTVAASGMLPNRCRTAGK